MILAYRTQHPAASLARLCAAVGINRSWFYQACQVDHAVCPEDLEAVALRGRIEEIVLDMP